MWYGSSLFVEDLALGCQIHSKRLLHGHIFCVVKLLFQLEIFMAVAEERRSPPELRHANKLVSKSIFFQPFALNTSPTTFLRKATNETYRFEMFRSWNSMNMNLADACGPQLESLSVWAVISIDTATIILEVGRLNLFLASIQTFLCSKLSSWWRTEWSYFSGKFQINFPQLNVIALPYDQIKRFILKLKLKSIEIHITNQYPCWCWIECKRLWTCSDSAIYNVVNWRLASQCAHILTQSL